MEKNFLTIKDIQERILNSTYREEWEYWTARLEEAERIGIDFANETYQEDLKFGVQF